MLPFPQILLFLPICIFAALFALAAAITFVAGIGAKSAKTRPQVKRAASDSAQIIYFRPRKTSLASGLSLGAR